MKSSKGCEAYSVHPRVLNTVTLEIKKRRQALSFLDFVDIERTLINLESVMCGNHI